MAGGSFELALGALPLLDEVAGDALVAGSALCFLAGDAIGVGADFTNILVDET